MKVVVITALWCPSCLMMRKRIDAVKASHPEIVFEELDFDFDEDQVKPYNVGNKLPVFIRFNDQNEELSRFKGERTIEALEGAIIYGETN